MQVRQQQLELDMDAPSQTQTREGLCHGFPPRLLLLRLPLAFLKNVHWRRFTMLCEVLGVQQSESLTYTLHIYILHTLHTHISILFQVLFPYRLVQSIE